MPKKKAKPSKKPNAKQTKAAKKPAKAKAKKPAKAKAKKPAKAKATKPAKAKATKPAKSEATKPASFGTLAAWKQVPLEEAAFDFGEATNDSVHWEDTFGDIPENLMIHKGDVAIGGSVELDGHKAPEGLQQTAYIVDGNLDIAGSLVFSQSDICTPLWVTGNLTVDRLACYGSAMLIVGGNLTVKGVAVTSLEDAGHLIGHGGFVAGAWIDLAQGRGCIELAQAPQARFISEYYSSKEPQPVAVDDEDGPVSYRPWNLTAESSSTATLASLHDDDGPDERKLVEAIRNGAAILA